MSSAFNRRLSGRDKGVQSAAKVELGIREDVREIMVEMIRKRMMKGALI